ncbi:MAG: hypothetical protein ACRC1K_24310 [Planctomycetia bacterium]
MVDAVVWIADAPTETTTEAPAAPGFTAAGAGWSACCRPVVRNDVARWAADWRSERSTTVEFQLGELRFTPAGRSAAVATPTVDHAYKQAPFVFSATALPSAVGLSLTAQVVPFVGGWTADFCLKTHEEVDAVELGVIARLTRGGRWTPVDDAVGATAVVGVEGAPVVYVDPADGGGVTATGDVLEVRLFRQPLERGVILVGRIGVFHPETAPTFADWLDQRTYL